MSSIELETQSIETIREGAPAVVPGRRGIVRDAGIISIANVTSRVLGLIRETVFANQFGGSGAFSAFVAASTIPMMIYDMLIGGLLSSALVPVFSERSDDRAALWRAVSVVLSVTVILAALLVLLIELFASVITLVLVSGFGPELRAVTTTLIRIVTPAILLLSLSGVLTGVLYALKRFSFAAFGAAVYNLGLIAGAVLLTRGFDGQARIYGLALGVLLGSIAQLILLTPDLRDHQLRFTIDWQHPVLRRIIRLYLPIALGFVVSHIGVIIDRNLASTTGEQSIGWMRYATTLIQLPLGLVATAISLAVLPSLSRLSSEDDHEGYRATLYTGVRMILVLIIPATIGLFVLAEPIIGLLFEHGEFSAYDALWTSRALRLYLIGLTFAAIDQVLVFGYYARQNTLTPALVGVAAVGIYLAVALPLVRVWGMLALVFANSMQWLGHAAIMLWLTHRSVGGVARGGVLTIGLKALGASIVMGGATLYTLRGLQPIVPPGFVGESLLVAVPAGVGIASYAAMTAVLRMEEAWDVIRLITARLR